MSGAREPGRMAKQRMQFTGGFARKQDQSEDVPSKTMRCHHHGRATTSIANIIVAIVSD